ncbi:MAG: amino acid adenylation domain-containing protein [Verrucomicrobiia bacterium]
MRSKLWRAAEIEKPAQRSAAVIFSVFEKRAAESGEAVAVRCGEEELSYQDLNARANKLARHLQRLGIGPEELAAIYLERGNDFIVAILGILKAGGAYVPLDPASPPERLQWMLEDASPRLILTERKLASNLFPQDPTVVCLDTDRESIERESGEDLGAVLDESAAAYVIYTSGSTGKPKGVVVTHRNVVRLFQSTEHWFRFTDRDVWTLFHSFAFDFSVWEMWGALFYGGRLVIVPHLVSRSPRTFHDLLVGERVTVLNQTPSAFRQLIQADAESNEELALRWVVFGGEALEFQSLRAWFERHGDQRPRLVNMYGITETTVHVTYRVITLADLEAGRGSVIGESIPDLTLHILDEHQRPCPVGVAGEIAVGGEGVARGYLRRPELTAERFIPDPFSSKPGARLYRSGDLARRLPDGDIEYLGRIDDQVKIRGFRIELGEIEAVLHTHPLIRQAAVVAHGNGTGDKRLVAYLASPDKRLAVDDLRQFLGRKIPEYMIPAQFEFVAELPLTLNGKVDRRALPVPKGMRPALGTAFVAPATDAERTLAAIWEDVLGVAPIGTCDNFFALGGDSIRSIQVLARAQQAGLNFSLEQLFEQPTVSALARLGGVHATDEVRQPPRPFEFVAPEDRELLPSEGLEDAYPMTRLQAGMVYHSSQDLESAIFHDIFSFRFRLEWDEPKFSEAVARLGQRHPTFRTSFDLGRFSEPLQLVHRTVTIAITVEDMRNRPEKEQKAGLVDWVALEKRRPFDWSQPPFLRLHVQRYAENVFQLIVSFHHVIMDGWSLAAMLTELFQEYAGLLTGQNVPIPAPPVTFREYVLLERETLESEVARSFWRSKLSQAVVHQLPRWPASLRKSGHEQTRGPERVLSREVLEGLRRVASDAGVPFRTVLLAAHCRVVSVLTGQEDLLTGLVTNGRPQVPGGERIIGLFLNTLPFRIQMRGGTWRDLVLETFRAEREIIPHRRFPLAEIQQMNGGQPLFETVFDFVQFHVYRVVPGYKERSFLEDHYFEANNFTFYQTFMLDADGEVLQMHCDYDPNALCESQVDAISEYYANTLEAIARSAESRYQAHSPLSAAERQRQLIEWNRTERPFPESLGVHDLIAAQAARRPDAVAVVADDGSYTYGALERRSAALAERLRTLGAGPGTLVGIHMNRSREMLASLLGVLKAGAAYVPLDPAYPLARLEFMAKDAGLELILTSHLVPELGALPKTRILTVDELTRGKVSGGEGQVGRAAPEDLAYVIYTSGSTGKPKGVEIPHRALVNFLVSMQREPGFSSGDTLLGVTTLSFDIAALELFIPLISGGRVVIANRETSIDPEALGAALDEHEVTVMQATPTTWRTLVQSGWKGRRGLKALCGGEAMSRELANALLDCCDEVWNMYGPTETTVWSLIEKVNRAEETVSIGRPIANTQVHLLDAHRNLAPTGTPGEICIGGAGLARGYLGRPELTAERFVQVCFDGGASVRVYRTGDLGRYLPDGRLVCLGRTDNQVKIRGFRLEPGEIEQVLGAHPAIAATAVAVKPHHGDPRLVAYYIVRPSERVSAGELRRFLESSLPPQAVPSAFQEVLDFPLTPNGKIDRIQLPEPEVGDADAELEFVPPRTPLEVHLAELWKDLLEVKQVGLHDNFFALGGHSLLVIRLIGRLRHELRLDISLRALFENPTLESFAQEVLKALIGRNGADVRSSANALEPAADS